MRKPAASKAEITGWARPFRPGTRPLALTLVSAAVASAAVVSPAGAGQGIHVTFQLIGGSLSISEPGSIVLGEAPTGAGSLQAHLGDITVTDNRGARLSGYTVHVVGAAFSTGSGASTYAIPAGNVSYLAPPVIEGTGTAVRVAGDGGSLDQARVAMTATGVVGNNTSVWNPTVTVTLPSDAVAGIYTGTVTHSVA